MNPVITAIDAGHVASWVMERAAMTVINAMRARREVPGECKLCNVPWPCEDIYTARLLVRIRDMRATWKVRVAA